MEYKRRIKCSENQLLLHCMKEKDNTHTQTGKRIQKNIMKGIDTLEKNKKRRTGYHSEDTIAIITK